MTFTRSGLLKYMLGAAAALVLLFTADCALAAKITGSTLPVSMMNEGYADINITVLNDYAIPDEGEAGRYVTNVSAYSDAYPEMYFSSAGEIAPGESATISANYYITADMINNSIPITVTYIDDGEEKSDNISVKIQGLSSASVSVTRSASTKQASPGDEVTLTYTIKNSGEFPVEIKSIVDRQIGGRSSIKERFTLDAGAHIEIPYAFRMGNSTLESAPVVTYEDGLTGEELTATCSPLTLGMVNSKISVEVIQGEPSAAGVTFTLNLTNNGNQRVSEIRITDELGNRVNESSFALAVGETKQLTYTVVPEEERYVVFTIKGESSSGDYEDNTKSYIVREYIDPALLGIDFKANVTETLNAQGSIEVQFDILNSGTMTMTDLVISELTTELDEEGNSAEKLTELYRTDQVVPGSFSTTQTVYVGEPRSLAFVVDLKDPAGNPYSYRAYISAEYLGVADTVDTETAQQNVIDALGATLGDSIAQALETATKALSALIVISVVSMLVLFLLEQRHRKEMARRRALRDRKRSMAQPEHRPSHPPVREHTSHEHPAQRSQRTQHRGGPSGNRRRP